MPRISLKRRYFHEKWLLFLSSRVKKQSNFHKIRFRLNFEPALSNQITTLCKRWDTPLNLASHKNLIIELKDELWNQSIQNLKKMEL